MNSADFEGAAIRRLWYCKPDDVVSYGKFFNRSHHAAIRVYDDVGNVIQAHEHKGGFKDW